MPPDTAELMPPRVLVVDDERQIHASLRLRLGRACDLVFCFTAADALTQIRLARFDLCLTDIHMPKMDGLALIEAAQTLDPCLGFVVLSAFDSHENLRRTIPLQVYDFISKPLPEKIGFEDRISGWIERTRQHRRDHDLAARAATIANDRDVARLERDVEFIASETARDALLQTANLLTTIHAHLLAACTQLADRSKANSSLTHLNRSLDEARRTADAAMTAAESFFDSSYGSRDSSPAIINEGMSHAIDIASRMTCAENTRKVIDFARLPERQEIRGLTGIEFLMTMVPAIAAAITAAPPQTTIGIRCENLSRLDTISRNVAARSHCWMNRKNSQASHAAIAVTISAGAPPLTRSEVELWLRGEHPPLASIAARGLLSGIQKSRGLLGFSTSPESVQFRIVLALPV